MDTYKLNKTLRGNGAFINTVSFSNNEKFIITGDEDGNVTVWDIETNQPIFVYRGVNEVNSALLSPDGIQIIIGHTNSKNGALILSTGQFVEWGDEDSLLAFNRTGTQIVSGDLNGNVKIWDAITKEVVRIIVNNGEEQVTAIIFNPSGDKIACGINGQVIVYEVATGKNVLFMGAENDDHDSFNVSSIAFSPDGNKIVSSQIDNFDENNNFLNVWVYGEQLYTMATEGNPYSVIFSPDGKSIVSVGMNIIQIWDADQDNKLLSTINCKNSILSIDFNHDGSKFVVGGSKLQIWESRDWETMMAIDESIEEVRPGIPHELIGTIAGFTGKSSVPKQYIERSTANEVLFPKGGKRSTRKRSTRKRKINKKRSVKSNYYLIT